MFVKIGRYTQRALIDTGAHYSCVSMSFVKRLHLLPKVIRGPNQKRLFTADGKPLMVAGTIQLINNKYTRINDSHYLSGHKVTKP